MIPETLSREQVGEARALLYAAVADVLESGPTAQSTDMLRSVESIIFPSDDARDPDLLAAEHYSLFGRSVMPYASSFLEEDGRLGGTVSHRFAVFYDEADWVLASNESEPDHFGTQFRFLAFLARMNHEAQRDGRLDVANYAGCLALRFITDFLSVGLPSFILAVSRTGDTFYSSVLETVWQVVIEQLGDEYETAEQSSLDTQSPADIRSYLLGSGPAQTDQTEPATLNLDLSNQRSSVRDIVAYLTNCRRSGIFLSQSDITRFSRAYSLPRGFGSRSMTLANLIRTAASLNELESLVESIIEMIDAERVGIVGLTDEGPLELKAIGSFFEHRLMETVAMLRDIVRLSNEQSFSTE